MWIKFEQEQARKKEGQFPRGRQEGQEQEELEEKKYMQEAQENKGENDE